jgi:hypothetical protein
MYNIFGKHFYYLVKILGKVGQTMTTPPPPPMLMSLRRPCVADGVGAPNYRGPLTIVSVTPLNNVLTLLQFECLSTLLNSQVHKSLT